MAGSLADASQGRLLQFELAVISLIGAREENQDRIATSVEGGTALIAVFDGMGGHSDGARAAELARQVITNRFTAVSHPMLDPLAFLHIAMGAAHSEMVTIGLDLPMEQRPRATGAACLIQDDTAWWIHVGDSRIYHLRDGSLVNRTRDHSHVELLVQEGLISSYQALSHPLRNYVESCLGGDPMLPEMLVGRRVDVRSGDIMLVCSDGFWSNLLDEDIAASLYSGVALNTAIRAVSEFAVRRAGVAADNTSVVAVRIL
jgi:serine/threonine protein phosphatase PrpC